MYLSFIPVCQSAFDMFGVSVFLFSIMHIQKHTHEWQVAQYVITKHAALAQGYSELKVIENKQVQEKLTGLSPIAPKQDIHL